MSRMAGRGRGMLTNLARGESGYGTLTAVLILLILGALVLTPLLVYMGTGLEAGQTHERRTDELYAADAGVDYALWHIQMGQVPEFGSPLAFDLDINDKDVHVDIYKVEVPGEEDEPAYRIVSAASSSETVLTAVESYVSIVYSTASLLDAAITVREDAEIKGDVVGDVICGGNLIVKARIDGDVLCGGDVWILPGDLELGTSGGWIYGNVRCGGTVNLPERVVPGPPEEGIPDLEIPEVDYWPDADIFRQRYLDDVQDSDPYLFDTINLAGISTSIGPLYRDGDLDIENSGGPATLTLDGTIYVTGQLNITGKLIDGEPNLTLDLNGQTIFCEYFDRVHPAIDVTEKCTIKGPGCIIAVGNIGFGPKMAAGGEEDYVILMSINGWTDLHPQGDFYGSVLVDVEMELFPAGGKITYVAPDPGDELNFPIFNTAEINTYNIYHYVPD